MTPTTDHTLGIELQPPSPADVRAIVEHFLAGTRSRLADAKAGGNPDVIKAAQAAHDELARELPALLGE